MSSLSLTFYTLNKFNSFSRLCSGRKIRGKCHFYFRVICKYKRVQITTSFLGVILLFHYYTTSSRKNLIIVIIFFTYNSSLLLEWRCWITMRTKILSWKTFDCQLLSLQNTWKLKIHLTLIFLPEWSYWSKSMLTTS